MRPMRSLAIIFTVIFLFSIDAFAQNLKSEDGPRVPNQAPGVLRQLGLTPAQLQQIRDINIKRRPVMQSAQDRVRDAGRRLDEAIYADVANDAEVQTRLKEFHTAQAEVSRIRFMNEFAIRKVLNAEQLAKFRDLRKQFESNRGVKADRATEQMRRANIRRMMRTGKSPN
jgi:Spy/CpxP family protein refolding chaperone